MTSRKTGKRVRAALARLAFLAAALSVTAVPAEAAARRVTAAEAAQEVRSGAELFRIATHLIAQGRTGDALDLVRAWKPGDATHSVRVAFTEGLIARKQGDHARSVAIFRQILSKEPGFSQVRRELAFSLYLAGDPDGARHQADLLVKAGIDDGSNGLRSLIRAIDDARPLQVSFFASLAPSSNANQGTGRDVIMIGGLPFVIDEESKGKAGLGLLFGADIAYRQTFTPTTAFVAGLTVKALVNPFDKSADLSLDGSVGIDRRIGPHLVRAATVGRLDLADGGGVYGELGLSGEALLKTGKKDQTRVSARLVWHRTKGAPGLDGWKFRLNASHDHMLSPSRFVRLLGAYETDRTESRRSAYQEAMFGAGGFAELPNGFSVYGEATAARRVYEAPTPVFGVRKDWRFETKLTLTKRDFLIHGMAPQATYSYTRNVSTDPFHDYGAHGFDLKLTKEF